MRFTLLITTLLGVPFTYLSGQEYLAGQPFGDFYDWFNQQSQVEDLYTDRATLYVFGDEAPLRMGPCVESAVITRLPIGTAVTNLVHDEFFMPEGELDGYGDLWYYVKGWQGNGCSFEGYLWGGDIAKSWQKADLTGDGRAEFLMMGIAAKSRVEPTDINAEIRILHNGRLWYQKLVPGLCVFEDCATSTLLRVIDVPQTPGLQVVEASTMALGCWAGVEKAFFQWNGSRLDCVYYAEYTTGKSFEHKSFIVEGENGTQLCRYSHEDDQYNPVWDCKTIKVAPAPVSKDAVAVVGR